MDGPYELIHTIGIHEQLAWMKRLHPGFVCQIVKGLFICKGEIQPRPISRSYHVRIEYRAKRHPKVWIEEPPLRRRERAALAQAMLMTGNKVLRINPTTRPGRFTLDDSRRIDELRSLGVAEARHNKVVVRNRFFSEPACAFTPFVTMLFCVRRSISPTHENATNLRRRCVRRTKPLARSGHALLLHKQTGQKLRVCHPIDGAWRGVPRPRHRQCSAHVGREHRRRLATCVSRQKWGRPTRAGNLRFDGSRDGTDSPQPVRRSLRKMGRFLTHPATRHVHPRERPAAVAVVLVLLGFALLAYYQADPSRLPADKTIARHGDELFPFFISNHLPVGLTGLVMCGMFAAAMSSIDSGINSITAVVTSDFVDRFRNTRLDEQSRIRFARWLALTIGLVVVSLSSFVIDYVPGNFLEQAKRTFGLLVTPMFLLFLIALFIPFATQGGAIAGAVVGFVASFLVAYWDLLTGLPAISFQWIFPVSLTEGIVVGCVWSLLYRRIVMCG